jgi:hypothetical protein
VRPPGAYRPNIRPDITEIGSAQEVDIDAAEFSTAHCRDVHIGVPARNRSRRPRRYCQPFVVHLRPWRRRGGLRRATNLNGHWISSFPRRLLMNRRGNRRHAVDCVRSSSSARAGGDDRYARRRFGNRRVEEDGTPEPGEICDALSGPHLFLSALKLLASVERERNVAPRVRTQMLRDRRSAVDGCGRGTREEYEEGDEPGYARLRHAA